jgi:hypothetical protein
MLGPKRRRNSPWLPEERYMVGKTIDLFARKLIRKTYPKKSRTQKLAIVGKIA